MLVSRGRRGRRDGLLALLPLLGMVVALLTAGTASSALERSAEPDRLDKIHPLLRAEMETTGTADRVEALVVLRARPQLERSAPEQVASELERAAATSQAPVVTAVQDRGDEVRTSFWLQNMVLVEAKPATLATLAASAAVDRIIPNFQVELPPTPETDSDVVPHAEDSTWGIERIRADAVHRELGYTGDGVRVAVLDTGVDVSHPDLAGKMVTNDPTDPSFPGGWIEFDAAGQPVPSGPRDSSYHGTHVAGTVLGGDASGVQIGVAPDAELMAAMIIPGGSGTFTQVIAGMQWAIAPVDADGDPAGEPADVINMSLGGCDLAQEMIEPTRNLRAARIFAAFSIGNDAPNCFSCGPYDTASPANVYEAVGVGATDIDENVAGFSCGGVINTADWADPPASWPESYVKPDLSAPGVDVLSAQPGGGYQRLNGTSMASPHVAGAAALMLSARADIGVDAAVQTLAGTAFFDDRYGAERPNPRYGWGRIDAFDAVSEAALQSGVVGVVTDAETGEPIAGAVITRVDTSRSIETDSAGRFEMRMPAGTYTVEISEFGYETETVEDIAVEEDEFTKVDRQLSRSARGSISGTVTFGPTGSTVPGATVSVLDVPTGLSGTTTGTGEYLISDVPVGSYSVEALTPDRARSEAAEIAVTANATTRVDLTLARPPATERVSLRSDGGQGNGDSQWASLSTDGRHVAFGSIANNLVEGDTNGEYDVFVGDRQTGITERVSVASDGTEADSFSVSPRLSAGGRHVGFSSGASNLVEGDVNGATDVFVRDLSTGVTERVSVTSDGSEGDDVSAVPALSADGRHVAFRSDATNLVEDDTNGASDIFVRDRQRGVTERVSVAPEGTQGDRASRDPSISADGRYVTFHSDATNLVVGDDNAQTDVFVHDLQTGETVRISGPGEGATRDATISPDGRAVGFNNRPTTFGLAQVYVHDLETGTTDPVSVAHDGTGMGNRTAAAPSLSADGGVVAFYSGASDLVDGDANGRDDIFVRDRRTGTTELVSLAPGGPQADGHSALPSLTPDGRYVAFQTRATNLVDADSNGLADVFVLDLDPEQPAARFAVWNLEIRQPVVGPNQPVVVTVRVKNIGDLAGEYDAVLRVDGRVEDTTTVELGPDSSSRVTFRISGYEPGSHDVAVGHTTGRFTVSWR